MAIEYPVTINEFNQNWPDGLDSKSQGDDHIRNIKGAIKRTFPNITGPVTVTQAQLNILSKVGITVSPGMIMMWPYSADTIPTGWKLCNGVGNISTGQAIPDLTNRFPVGAGVLYSPGETGGISTHTHIANTVNSGTSLTPEMLPAHTHGIPTGSNDTTESAQMVSPGNNFGSPSPAFQTIQTGSVGSGVAHTHTANTYIAPSDNRPPFFGVFFIIKD